MSLLYKYVSPDPPYKEALPLPLLILQTMRLSITDPRTFNDPFEVRPWFDQERHDFFAKSHESFYQKFGIKHPLTNGRSMVGLPTEKAVGFGEHLNRQFRDKLGRKYRVLCLSLNPRNVLMWGHYTRSHAGVVFGLDASVKGFPQGMKQGGYNFKYSPDRSRTKLPLAYYQEPSVETFDLLGDVVNNPNEEVLNGNIIIPFSEYRRQVDEATLTALTTKAQDWEYEGEVRYIYELPLHRSELVYDAGRFFAQIPPEALREIIIGFRASYSLVKEIVRLYREGKIGKPKLFFSGCHPNLYEVQAHQVTDQYLLDYYEKVLPNS